MNNKLQTKDLINLGLFTVLYFVIGCCVAIPIGFVPIFLPILGALWTLVTGISFMLFLTRVKKFGMVTLMAILSGFLMGLTGMGYWGVPVGIVSGLLGDFIMKSGNYKSLQKGLLGYAVFSLWMDWNLHSHVLYGRSIQSRFCCKLRRRVCRQSDVRDAHVEYCARHRRYFRVRDSGRTAW